MKINIKLYNIRLLDVIIIMEDDNIQINVEKGENTDSDLRIILITYYSKENNICLKAIYNNINNSNIKKVIVFNKTSFKFEEDPKLEVINVDHPITYQNIIEYGNKNYTNNVIGIINPDCYIGNSALWENIYTDLYNNKNFLYGLSCIETNIDQTKMWKDKIHGPFLYSYKQDCYVYMSPFNNKDMSKYNINFWGNGSEFIKTAKEEDEYIVINLSMKYNIMRINSVEEEENGCPVAENVAYALPDFEGISNVSIDMLCSKFNLSNYEKYLIKCDLLMKYKNKLVKK